MSTVVDTVTEIVTPILEAENFELVEVEFTKEGQSWFLRVFIDKDGGIDLEDCAFVSERFVTRDHPGVYVLVSNHDLILDGSECKATSGSKVRAAV